MGDFLLGARADGLSGATVKWYRSILGRFVEAAGDRQIAEIGRRDMREYIAALRDTDARYVNAPNKPQQSGGLSAQSVAAHVRALFRFWSWVSLEAGISNPMDGIRRPKFRPGIPKAAEKSDFVRLFQVANERDRCILAFLADTGCRLSSVCGLKVGQVDIDARRAVVIEKGDKVRTLYFGDLTRAMLAVLVKDKAADAPIFVGKGGAALTSQGVYAVLKRLKAAAAIEGRVNPHSWRHAFAREYIKGGGDLATLSRILGHGSVTVTASYYAVFDTEELAEFHRRYSPIPGDFDS